MKGEIIKNEKFVEKYTGNSPVNLVMSAVANKLAEYEKETLFMHVLVKRLKPRQQIGYADSRSVMINHGGGGRDDKAGFSSLELWLFALASSAATSMEGYAEEKGWNLAFLQIEVEEEVNEEGDLMDVKFYITAEGLNAGQRGEMFGTVRQECGLLRTVNPNVELYFADRLVTDGIGPAD